MKKNTLRYIAFIYGPASLNVRRYNDSNMKTRESPDQNAKEDFRLPYKLLNSSKKKKKTEKGEKKTTKITKKKK